MKLLLDTHIWLNSVLDPRRIGRKYKAAINDPRHEVWLSPVSLVELVLLVRSGRIRTIPDPGQWALRALAATDIIEAPMTYDIAAECDNFELATADPFDRIIVSTARVLNMTLLTHDEKIIEARVASVLTDN